MVVGVARPTVVSGPGLLNISTETLEVEPDCGNVFTKYSADAESTICDVSGCGET
jgi:hypothetical protein